MDDVKALTFDIFGTVVDWRTSIEAALRDAAQRKIKSPEFGSVPEPVWQRAQSLTDRDWATFAQHWRDSYGRFTHSFIKGQTAWKDVDTHHRESLTQLLDQWQLAGLYADDEIERLSKAWHFLDPWEDVSAGIHRLGQRFVTATLSNGNHTLLRDLQDHGNLGFKKLLSAEDFGAYKPSPDVYLGACDRLGLKPGEVAMVAAHLHDLAAARACGLRTVFVERPREEPWPNDSEAYRDARKWVDAWIAQGEGGFVELAHRLAR